MDNDLREIQHLTGEQVSSLAKEFGPRHAADRLKAVAAEVRLAGSQLVDTDVIGNHGLCIRPTLDGCSQF
jgi:hypothetical protein